MEKQRSLSMYRTIDLMLWAAILVIFEGVILRAAKSMLFSDQVFTVSLAAPITCIVFMRWGIWGAVHAVLAGIEFAILGGGNWRQLLVYGVGNLLALMMIPVMKWTGRERIRQSSGLSITISLGTLLSMQLGRGLIALLTGAGVGSMVPFFTTDSLSAVFTIVIAWIVRRLDGVFEDQRHYLSRLQEEQKTERMDSL